MNIKPWLEAEADRIVDTFRKEGGDINDLIAKHAASKQIEGERVHSLVWLVNRHSFKLAKQQDGQDEFEIANPDDVELRLRRLRTTKSASAAPAYVRPGVIDADPMLGGQALAGGLVANNGHVVHLQKLASRRQELTRDIRIARGRVTAGLYRAAMLAESIKRAGLLDSQTFQAEHEKLATSERAVIDAVFCHVKAARVPAPSRAYVERALADYRELVKIAGEVRTAQRDEAEAKDRVETVDAVTGRIRGQAQEA
jgi:hypothetical protein